MTADGVEREVDAIVYGTGFRTLDFTSPVRFVGPGGMELDDVWKTRPQAYLGVATAGFPNLFFITGPNSRVANNSIVFMIESQIHYVINCLRHLRDTGAETMEVRPRAQELFNAGLTRRAKGTVFATGCKSWYLDAKGESPVLWPGVLVGVLVEVTADQRGRLRDVVTGDITPGPFPPCDCELP